MVRSGVEEEGRHYDGRRSGTSAGGDEQSLLSYMDQVGRDHDHTGRYTERKTRHSGHDGYDDRAADRGLTHLRVANPE